MSRLVSMIVGIASVGVIASAASAAPIPLTNPSFETANSTDSTKPAGWSASPQKPAEIVWTRSASNAVQGSYSLAVHSSWNGLSGSTLETRSLVQDASASAVVAGETYRAKVSYFQAAGTGANSQQALGNLGHLTFFVRWYDAAGAALNTVTLVDTESTITPGQTYTNGDVHSSPNLRPQGYIHMDLLAPANAARAGFVIDVGTWIPSGRPYHIDDLSLATVPEPAGLAALAMGVGFLARRRRDRQA